MGLHLSRTGLFFCVLALLLALAQPATAAPDRTLSINVLLNTPVTSTILADLGTHGKIFDVMYEIKAVVLLAKSSELPVIQALPYVESAGTDAEREGKPIDTVSVTDFTTGLNTWDLDAINVTDFGVGRVAGYAGSGVYVAVLDTGLLDSWRSYFPQERIAAQYATSFQGGGAAAMNLGGESPNKWEHDQNSHGTHVTSTILGYQFGASRINGVAPMATVIPVKVLNQNGSGWSSAIAHGLIYVTNLKLGPLGGAPLVVNMSLGGSSLDPVEQAAIDYAVGHGVIVVASAGNRGNNGMGYPGAYAPVISVAATGWLGEWSAASWWRTLNVPDPSDPSQFYIAPFSSRARTGQDLDVAAPGSWVVGPYQLNSGTGRLSYYYLGGTSMSSPHVAGTVALMLQKNPGLTASAAEGILESSAIPMDSGCRYHPADMVNYCWGPGFDPPTSLEADGSGMVDALGATSLTP